MSKTGFAATQDKATVTFNLSLCLLAGVFMEHSEQLTCASFCSFEELPPLVATVDEAGFAIIWDASTRIKTQWNRFHQNSKSSLNSVNWSTGKCITLLFLLMMLDDYRVTLFVMNQDYLFVF